MPLPTPILPDVRLIADSRDALGEGIVWDGEEGHLWWVDIAPAGRLHRLHLESGLHQTWGPFRFPTGLALCSDGALAVVTLDGIGRFHPAIGRLVLFARVEDADNGNRPNDAGADPMGRLWVGTMQQNIAEDGSDLPITRASGAIWSIDRHHDLALRADGFGIVNAPTWSPDGRRFYVADSMARTLYAYDYEPTSGAISNRSVLSDEASLGYPDGACMDEDGYLWNARWDAAAVLRIAPDGRIDRIYRVPALRPTCCVFGGPDRRTLFVTSSRAGLPAEEIARHPWAGGVMAFDTDVVGLPRHRFAG